MLIYFLVEDSQGNFSVSPPEKAFPARLLNTVTAATTAGTVTFPQKWVQFTSFSESRRPRAVYRNTRILVFSFGRRTSR